MGKKIFVSYKYGDSNVERISSNYFSLDTARNYVDKLESIIGRNDIYKGEKDNNDLSTLADDTIWTELKRKIYDSTITIVLISPNMKDSGKKEVEQWIPQEISYSLKEIKHDGVASRTNALIYVVLPDRNGSYDYFISQNYFGYTSYATNRIFAIMSNNINNCKYYNDSYAVIATWTDFVRNYSWYINEAVRKQNNASSYNICKQV